jgi:hypothetical protein
MCKFGETRAIVCGLALFAAVSAALGCPAPSPVAPPIDATDAAIACASACATLARLGCPEGSQPNCVPVLAHIESARARRGDNGAPLTCSSIAAAVDAATVSALGVECGQ